MTRVDRGVQLRNQMMGDWTFFSNHGHVLVCLARDGDARLRDVAVKVGITERAVQKIVRDLDDAGYLEVSKHGRCNRYRINNRKALRHPLQAGCTVGQLLNLLSNQRAAQAKVETQQDNVKAEPPPSPEPPSSSEPPSSPEPPPRSDPSPEPKRDPASDLEQGRLF